MYGVLPHTVPILWGKNTCCSHMSIFHAHVCSCLYKTNFFVRMQVWLICIDCWGRLSYLSLLFFGTLHSNEYIFPILLCFSLLFTAICKASSDSHFAFLHFYFLGMVFIPVSCTMSWTSIHSSSVTLSDLVP